LRFFFHLDDGIANNDIDGTELPDMASVKAETSRLCGTMLADAGRDFWLNPDWRIRVTDETGHAVLTLTLVGTLQ